MTKAASSKKKPLIDRSKYIDNIFLALISIFIIIIPFYRGLYFRENYIPSIIFISLLYSAFLVYKLLHKDFKIADTFLDIAVMLIPVCYLISYIFGFNAKDSLDLFLLYASYFMMYRISSDITKNDEKNKNILLNLIIGSTFITAFTSILTLSGLLSLKGVVTGNRIFGLYQYTNTTASMFALGIVLTLNTLIASKDIKMKFLYQGILTTLLATLVFTLSKGGLLSLLIVLMINFMILNGKSKISFILNILISALSNFLFISKFYNNTSTQPVNIMPDYLISIIICFAFTFALHFFQKKYSKNISDKKVNIVLTTLLLFFVSIITFLFLSREPIEYRIEHLAGEEKSWKNTAFYINDIEKETDYVFEFDVKSSLENPYSYGVIIRSYNEKNEFQEIYKEFSAISDEFQNKKIKFSTLQDTDRLLFFLYNYETDSYTIYKNVVLKDSFGNAIKKYERFKYIPDAITNRFKNFDLKSISITSRSQFMKDGMKIFKDYPFVGAGGGAWKNLYRKYQSYPYNTTEVHNFYVQYAVEVGILGLAVLSIILIQLFIGFIKSIKNKSDYLLVYCAVLLLLIHSFIDFNLSLPAVAFILWILIGILNNDSNISQVNLPRKKINCISFTIFSLLLLILSSSIYYGMYLGDKASKLVNKDMEAAIPIYQKAIKFDKYNNAYRVDYAQLMNNKLKQTQDVKHYNSMMQQIDKVRKTEPHNYKYASVIINLLLSNGQLDKAVSLADDRVNDEPMVPESYIMKIDVNYEIAKFFFSNSEHAKAIPYLENILDVEAQYKNVQERLLQEIELPKKYKTDMYGLARNWIEQANRIDSIKKK